MRSRWFLARPVVGAVAIAFTLTTAIPPGSFAQPEPEPESTPAGGESCDLTGQWRSTRGPMRLVQSALRPAPLAGVVSGETSAPASPGTGQAAVLAGNFRSIDGEGRLDGRVTGNRADVQWYLPGGEAGDGYFEIAEDCQNATGAYRIGETGEFTEPWRLRRIQAASPAEEAPDLAEFHARLARVDEAMGAVETLRDGLRRAEFDISALAMALAGSPEAIHAHVRDTIAYEAYQGVLRGARGTLVARAGNAADQSLLLAALLAEHGYQVRFALGTLEEDAAARLVDGMRAQPDAGPQPAADPQAEARLMAAAGIHDDQVATAAERQQEARESLLATVASDVSTYGGQIPALLARGGVALSVDAAEQRARLIARARQHVWVQANVDGAWVDLDPLAEGQAAGTTLTAAESTREELPEDAYHLVRFRVTIERLDSGALAEVPVAGWQIRVADLLDRGLPGIRISNLPLDNPEALAVGTSFEDLGALATELLPRRTLEATAFMPTLGLSTGEVQTGSGFDMRGRLVPDDWRIGAAAETAAVTEEAMGGAADALGSLFDEPEPADQTPAGPAVLTAQWIDFEVTGPGMDTRSERRFILDRIGPAARTAGVTTLPDDAPDEAAAKLALATMNEILVSAGDISRAFAFDILLANYARNREMLERLAALSSGVEPVDAGFLDTVQVYPTKLLTHLLLQQEQARLTAAEAGVYAYPDSAQVTVRQTALRQADGAGFRGSQAIDLVHVDRQVAAVAGLSDDALARFNREHGVALTSVEREMMAWIGRAACPDCELPVIRNTTTVMAAAAAQGVALHVLGPGDAAVLDGLQLEPGVGSRIADELARGHAVIVPETPVSVGGVAMTGWWRVDLRTGAVLGMMETGAGQSFLENLEVMILAFWPAAVGFGAGFAGCYGLGDGQSGVKLTTCLLCGLVGAICFELTYLAQIAGPAVAVATCGTGSTLVGIGVCTFGSLVE